MTLSNSAGSSSLIPYKSLAFNKPKSFPWENEWGANDPLNCMIPSLRSSTRKCRIQHK